MREKETTSESGVIEPDNDTPLPDLISNIEAFIEALQAEEVSSYGNLISRLKLSPSDFEQYINFEDGSYTRNYIHREEKFELILICWDCNIETPIHSHGGQQCWIYHLNGQLEEQLFELDNNNQPKLKSTHLVSSNSISYMDDKMGFHTLKTMGNQRALSLHIYASPICQCKVYCNDRQRFIEEEIAMD
ncbi:MAG: cysteine dioxygenase family protein [Saprospiraceae bacterium]|nr:cysteine dioxygenase family protein [Saprospiraceae bacterium]